MNAFFVSNDGPNPGKRYTLQEGASLVGRHPDCQIVVDVGAVSRKHAQVLHQDDAYFLEDLKSRNGTFLNDQMVTGKQRLKHGDTVRVCDITFRFEESRPGVQTPPEPVPITESSYRSNRGSHTVLVDDTGRSDSASSIMSKLDVSASRGYVEVSSSPEAKLAALLEMTRSMAQKVALDDVLPQVIDCLFKIFVQADRGFIVMETDDGALAPMWTRTRRGDDDETIRISRTIVKQVMENQEAILSADAANDARFEMSESVADFRIRSMMCAPLVDLDGKSIGVLQIDTLDQSKRFSVNDLEVLASVAMQASIAIDNASLYEREVQRREIERDLALAHNVQQGFLPDGAPLCEGYDFYDYYHAAHHIGGDYYDYVQLPDGRIAVIVADVTGHGIAAAMLVGKLSAEARFSLAVEPDPAKAVDRLNDAMCRIPVDKFVTMILVVFDPSTHEATIVNAGHMAPIHRRADGTLEEPGAGIAGLPLGIVAGREYGKESIRIARGEQLTLYTDGISECIDSSGKMYSIERLHQLIGSAPDSTPAETGAMITADVKKYLGDGEQEDDMCLVCCGRV